MICMAMLKPTATDSLGKDILFDAVFGKSTEGILLVTFDGLIEKANPAVSVLLGYSLSELERRSVLDLMHASDRHKRAPEIDNLLAGKIECIRAHRRFVTNSGKTTTFSVRTYPIHKDNAIVRVLTFLWPIDADPVEITESIERRLSQMEELLNKYGKPEEWRMVNNIHLGDEVGGDKSGRDKVTNDTRIFYFIGAVLAVVASLLAYLGYLATFPNHNGNATPPALPSIQEGP